MLFCCGYFLNTNTSALSGKKSSAKHYNKYYMKAKKTSGTAARAKKKKVIKAVITVFEKLARGLVKVWHQNHSFIISKEDAINLTLDQLNELVNEKAAKQ